MCTDHLLKSVLVYRRTELTAAVTGQHLMTWQQSAPPSWILFLSKHRSAGVHTKIRTRMMKLRQHSPAAQGTTGMPSGNPQLQGIALDPHQPTGAAQRLTTSRHQQSRFLRQQLGLPLMTPWLQTKTWAHPYSNLLVQVEHHSNNWSKRLRGISVKIVKMSLCNMRILGPAIIGARIHLPWWTKSSRDNLFVAKCGVVACMLA